MVQDVRWLTVAAAVARLRDAGYTDSPQTVRRMADAGELESHRTGKGTRGHRRIAAQSVDALILERQGEPAEAEGEPESSEPTEQG